ncbi:MAG: hypothetical protein DHS20C18_22780 [Saprospiraceae bacterium]|nr:MAG: hypothetical protein DHS20C18_22780 [Saprospiraceae bacterium]
MHTIDIVHHISPLEFNQQYFQEHKPVLIKGGGKDSKSFNHWSFDYLKNRFPERPVRVFYSETGYYNGNLQDMMTPFLAPFGEAIDYCNSGKYDNKSYYMKMLSLPEVFPELMNELELPKWNLPTDVFDSVNLWIGGAGCITSLHFDFAHNFFMQIVGRKEFTLFSPKDTPNLYPSPMGKTNVSQLNLEAVDYEKFPLFRNATPLKVVVEPGDILFNPPGWWHHVRSLDNAISLTSWWHRFELINGIGLEHFPVQEITEDIGRYLAAGMSIDHKGLDGEYLMISAIQKGFTNVVEALLTLGGNPNLISIQYRPSQSAMAIAKELGHEKIVRLLQQYGAKERQPDMTDSSVS